MGTHDIHIGTSGWHYHHWVGPFYPAGTPKNQMLQYYRGFFHTVELNNTFYQSPKQKTLAQWKNTVGQDFVFSVKASRFITHMKKLKNPRQPVERFIELVRVLENSLGPILFQLPPRWKANPERLEAFLKELPEGYRYAFEFRDHSWYQPGIYQLLKAYNASFCIYHLDYHLSPLEVTSELVYIRLHGPDGSYRGQYDDSTIASWTSRIWEWAGEGKQVYCYFDNDEAGYAAQDAMRLEKMVEEQCK
ncbi:MAG: DUF72 domain-containing protein [Spirochaetota bacterium]